MFNFFLSFFFFFFNDTATTEIYTLSLHDALPISGIPPRHHGDRRAWPHRRAHDLQHLLGREIDGLYRRPDTPPGAVDGRSEEHTSELQSLTNLVCRLLLEKKKQTQT